MKYTQLIFKILFWQIITVHPLMFEINCA